MKDQLVGLGLVLAGVVVMTSLVCMFAEIACTEKIDKYEIEHRADGTTDLIPVYTKECE